MQAELVVCENTSSAFFVRLADRCRVDRTELFYPRKLAFHGMARGFQGPPEPVFKMLSFPGPINERTALLEFS